VQVEPATCRVNPRLTVGSAMHSSISTLKSTTLTPCDPTLSIKPRRQMAAASMDAVEWSKAISDTLQHCMIRRKQLVDVIWRRP